jgi:hypothetical protein
MTPTRTHSRPLNKFIVVYVVKTIQALTKPEGSLTVLVLSDHAYVIKMILTVNTVKLTDICVSYLQLFHTELHSNSHLAFLKSFIQTIKCSYHALLDVVAITNTMHRFAPVLYSGCWLLHISALVCHHQGASGSV